MAHLFGSFCDFCQCLELIMPKSVEIDLYIPAGLEVLPALQWHTVLCVLPTSCYFLIN